MGPLDKYILRDDALKASEDGFQLKFQSHWYRSLALSCMDFKLKINNQFIDNQNVMVEVDGEKYTYDDMPNLDSVWLFILDRATLHVPYSSIKAGKKYHIEFVLDLYAPYILVGPEAKPLLASSKITKELLCQ